MCLCGHDSPPAPVVCVSSGHNCELDGTVVLWAVTPLQSSVSKHPVPSNPSDAYWPVGLEARGIPSLNCSIMQSVQGQTESGWCHFAQTVRMKKLENKVSRFGRIIQCWIIVSLSFSSFTDILWWNPDISIKMIWQQLPRGGSVKMMGMPAMLRYSRAALKCP